MNHMIAIMFLCHDLIVNLYTVIMVIVWYINYS